MSPVIRNRMGCQHLPPRLYLLFKRASPFSRPPRLPEGGSSVQEWEHWREVTGRPFPTLLLLQLSPHWAGLSLKVSEGPAGTPPPATSTLLAFREHSLGSWRHQQGLSTHKEQGALTQRAGSTHTKSREHTHTKSREQTQSREHTLRAGRTHTESKEHTHREQGARHRAGSRH